MKTTRFVSLTGTEWQGTRDAMQAYAKVVGKIGRSLAPRRKHWWHASLRAAATGLTTTPLPAGNMSLELLLDFWRHRLLAVNSQGTQHEIRLAGQPASQLCEQMLAALATMDVYPDLDRSVCQDTRPLAYDPAAAHRLWQVLSQIDLALKAFQATLRQETSPVQLWPHHFDLAMLWFSGRLVPDQDPDQEEWADEQMNFGFSTGDAGIPEPYFYVTAYPTPAGLTETRLPPGAHWHTQGWVGALLPYRQVAEAQDPQGLLLGFWHTVQQAGSALMR